MRVKEIAIDQIVTASNVRLEADEYRVWYVLRSRGVARPRDRSSRLLAEIFGAVR